MAKTKHPHLVKTTSRPYEEVEEMFEQAVEECLKGDKNGTDAPYWDGVRQALGWAIGEYPDAPSEE